MTSEMMPHRLAYFTFDDKAFQEHGYRLYYFAPIERASPPYRQQRYVKAIIDIADDGTLAGVELMDDMPPPPARQAPTDNVYSHRLHTRPTAPAAGEVARLAELQFTVDVQLDTMSRCVQQWLERNALEWAAEGKQVPADAKIWRIEASRSQLLAWIETLKCAREHLAALSALLAEVREVTGPFAEFVKMCGDGGPTECRISYMGSRGFAKLGYDAICRAAALHEKMEG